MNRRSFLAATLIGATCMTTKSFSAAAPGTRDCTVTVSGVEIACRFSFPGSTPKGGVLLLPGSLYSDVDGNYPSMNMRPHAYADLADQLGEQGFVVLRMAKIGPGTGSRTIDAAAAARHGNFLTRVDVAAAALNLLRQSVTARPIIVAGHSEGAVVASLLTAGKAGAEINGLVSLSGPALPILSLMRLQVAAMAPAGSTPDMAIFDRTVAAIRAGTKVPAEAKADPQTAMLGSMPEQALAYLRSIDKVDPVAALAQVRQPVLIVQGGRDYSVPASHAGILLAGRRALPTQVATFPNLTHFYKVAPGNLTPMQSMMLETTSDPAVADEIAGWIRAIGYGRQRA